MPVSVKKLRTLYVMKLLLERSDEENVLSTGDLIEGELEIGQAASLIHRIEPVAQIMQTLLDEFRTAVNEVKQWEI